MSKNQFSLVTIIIVALCISLFILPAQAAEQSATDLVSQGIQLFRDGKDKEAIQVLKEASKGQKENADLWHFLGMAQYRTNQMKDAVKSFQKAIKLRPDFVPSRISLAILFLRTDKLKGAAQEAEQVLLLDPKNVDANYIVAELHLRNGNLEDALKTIDDTLKLNNKFREAWLLRSQTFLGLFRKEAMQLYGKDTSDMPNSQRYAHYKRLTEAASSLEAFLKLTQNPADREFWHQQWEAMNFYAKWAEGKREAKEDSSQPESMKVSLRPTITYREKAVYTQAARDAGIQGIVLLLVMYSAEGELKHILVIKGLDYGLTQSAVNAARKIRFIPPEKNGKPVSVIGNIEFNFNLY